MLLSALLSPPPQEAGAQQHLSHAINEATWGLLGHLVQTNDPLGSLRQ
jgi:hypothetical protein